MGLSKHVYEATLPLTFGSHLNIMVLGMLGTNPKRHQRRRWQMQTRGCKTYRKKDHSNKLYLLHSKSGTFAFQMNTTLQHRLLCSLYHFGCQVRLTDLFEHLFLLLSPSYVKNQPSLPHLHLDFHL